MKIQMWRATFKDSPEIMDRRKWNGHDLEVILPADDQDEARIKVFEIAECYLLHPYINVLEKIDR